MPTGGTYSAFALTVLNTASRNKSLGTAGMDIRPAPSSHRFAFSSGLNTNSSPRSFGTPSCPRTRPGRNSTPPPTGSGSGRRTAPRPRRPTRPRARTSPCTCTPSSSARTPSRANRSLASPPRAPRRSTRSPRTASAVVPQPSSLVARAVAAVAGARRPAPRRADGAASSRASSRGIVVARAPSPSRATVRRRRVGATVERRSRARRRARSTRTRDARSRTGFRAKRGFAPTARASATTTRAARVNAAVGRAPSNRIDGGARAHDDDDGDDATARAMKIDEVPSLAKKSRVAAHTHIKVRASAQRARETRATNRAIDGTNDGGRRTTTREARD